MNRINMKFKNRYKLESKSKWHAYKNQHETEDDDEIYW